MSTFRKLMAKHPKMLRQREELCFQWDAPPSVVADEWRQSGVVMLRGVLPPDDLRECRQTFDSFIKSSVKLDKERREPEARGLLCRDAGPAAEWDHGEIKYGSWHAPWVIRQGAASPMATVVAGLVNSWAWPVVERICHSTDIVIGFGLCLGRHNIDQDLDVGIHQDATAVNPDVPLSIWIPLHDIKPKRDSGLGFVVPSPDHVVPAQSNNDIGEDYVLENLDKIWVPRYRIGDLTMHSRYSPHFTTGYGSLADRYSLEIRLWARDDDLAKYGDPSITINRRNGELVVSGTRCTEGVGAHGFIASTAYLLMQRIIGAAADAPSSAHPPKVTSPIGKLRSLVRRALPVS